MHFLEQISVFLVALALVYLLQHFDHHGDSRLQHLRVSEHLAQLCLALVLSNAH